ncbi:MAG: bifunctional aspartate kinase/homoserine dehydrogenase I [Saprospiraceae bacterium]|nr:bifunctional aspartate kinase/homoserine dehydrogenase I [Saprospiraceae bacterium]MCB9324904.1 bifunctional aspartate kinase/homoserine dehydrogenase I [Lewinellaceae bacterium]
MKVLKFGGSSVAKPERIRMILDILKDYYTQGEKFAVVFSAFGGVTDSLIEMSRLASKGDERYLELFGAFSKRHLDTIDDLLNEENAKMSRPKLEKNHEVLKNLLHGVFLVREASARTMDYVLSFGERNSCFIIQAALQQAGIPSSFLDARKIIKTDKHFGAANVDMELSFKNIKEYFNSHPEVQVVTGFIASSKGNLTTTLGRGGSDYTASLLAAGLNAALLEIWTDVNGVLTADPRKVKRAFTIPSMTYAEAMEMSHFGAKVIYPPTLQPALNKNIPLQIKNTFEPYNPGTLITDKGDKTDLPVKGISSITDLDLLTLQGSGLFGVPGIAGRLFGCLAQADINIILITQGSSEHSISFAIQPSLAKKAKRHIEKTFEYEMKAGMIDPVKVEDNLSVIAIIGENMRYSPGIAGRLFQALGKNGINITAIAQGSSELNISVVIDRPDEAKALNSLHEAFFLSDTKELHLYLIGVGLIGSTLLKQIKAHADHLKSQQSIEIKVVGLSNSKKMIFNENGINLNTWQEDLQNSAQHSNIPAFIQQMKDNNLSNTIFVDNTANEMIAGHYESILDSSISISTPNKIATSSSYLQYRRLKNIAAKRGVQFMYETNVGAGLPIISTLNDLMISGDSILKIEGVLSGSLSFIFNNFKAGTKFSELVTLAKEKGFTEPDPRIDINGIDVRRKLIILARETGLNIEAEDVVIKNILPEACSKAKSVDDFFVELKKADDYFDQMLKKASDKNCVLRMVAKLENGKATIGLEEVDQTHPFYTLDGSDNMIVFTSERYKERPLVVRGPGAGAEVTAAGVFAEVIKIGNFIT